MLPRQVIGIALLLAIGCGGPDPLELERWSLSGAQIQTRAVTVPADLGPWLPAQKSEYVLAADVVIPVDYVGRPLTFSVPSLPANVSLSANGVEAVALLSGLQKSHRSRGFNSFRIPAEVTLGGSLHLELTVRHTWTQSGWVGATPRLTRADQGDAHMVFVRIVNDVGGAVAAIAIAQLGLTYFFVFLLGRRRRVYLWFAVQGLTGAFYPLFVLGVTAGLLRTWEVNVLALAIAAAPVVAIYFTHAQFSLDRPHRVWLAVLGINCLAGIVVIDPFTTTQIIGKTVVVTVAIAAVYQIYTCARLSMRRPRPLGARTLLACWLILGITASVDFVAWFGWGELLGGARPACWGLATFALLQSLLLSREHFTVLTQTEHLNVELRRQIADRSRQLFAALALIDSGQSSAPDLSPGDVVQDRYRVVRAIGRGGMGTVYEVERIADGARFALKTATGIDSIALARLAREAQLVSEVSHEHVVGIADVDVADSGFLYIVLEYVDGDSLRGYQDKYGNVPWAIDILGQIAQGLRELHATGIIHRDLTPSNVLLTGDLNTPRVKIADFGISRRSDGEAALDRQLERRSGGDEVLTTELRPGRDSKSSGHDVPAGRDITPSADRIAHMAVTQAGLLTGTPRYMAPEMAAGPSAISLAADIFSFGSIAFEVLTGGLPFSEPPIVSVMNERDLEAPASLSTLCPELDGDIAAAVDRCLAVDVDARPTAAELAEVFSP